jgi:hypothetical protein
VKPRSAIWRESGGLALQKIQEFTFMLAQLVGEVRRAKLGRDDGQFIASAFKPQAKRGGPVEKLDRWIHISMASFSSTNGGFEV